MAKRKLGDVQGSGENTKNLHKGTTNTKKGERETHAASPMKSLTAIEFEKDQWGTGSASSLAHVAKRS